MKKKLTAILCTVLSAILLVALCACGSTWGKIKSAYEKQGYTEIKVSDAIREAIEKQTDEKLEESDATIHFMTKAKINDDDSDAEIIVKAFLSPFAIVLVMLQPGNSQGIDALGGSSETFYGKNKGKSTESKLRIWTFVCLGVLAVLAVVFFILQIDAIWNV